MEMEEERKVEAQDTVAAVATTRHRHCRIATLYSQFTYSTSVPKRDCIYAPSCSLPHLHEQLY